RQEKATGAERGLGARGRDTFWRCDYMRRRRVQARPTSPTSAVVRSANDPGPGTGANTRMQPSFPIVRPHAAALPGEVPQLGDTKGPTGTNALFEIGSTATEWAPGPVGSNWVS